MGWCEAGYKQEIIPTVFRIKRKLTFDVFSSYSVFKINLSVFLSLKNRRGISLLRH